MEHGDNEAIRKLMIDRILAKGKKDYTDGDLVKEYAEYVKEKAEEERTQK